MKKILVYTFSTFPYMKELEKELKEIFVFKKLKKEITDFCDVVNKNNPKIIIGIAKSSNKNSTLEPLAVNKFNKNKKVIKHENKEYKLFTPKIKNSNFKISKKPTTSFCNYSMYKIQNFIFENKLKTKLMFIHINKNDISSLKDFVVTN